MKFARAFGGIASACLAAALSACGGGGGDAAPRTSTVTLNTATTATAAATYTTQKSDRSVQNGGAGVGNVTVIEFAFGQFDVAFSYANNLPAVYAVGISDSTGDYLCGSTLASANTGIPACPSDMVFDLNGKAVRFNAGTLVDYYGSMSSVLVNMELLWN